MKRSIRIIGVSLMIALMLALASPVADAGRIKGPLSTISAVPPGLSSYYEVTFAAGDQAVVSIAGDGSSIVYVFLYDSDGHIAVGAGTGDRRTAAMNVYRTGVFRVEIRNMGTLPNTVRMVTN